MTEQPDYEAIVDGTVDAVKAAVEEQDLDPEKLLDAEKANKDRVTLIQWLEERMEAAVPEEVDVTDAESDAQYISMEMLPVQERTVTFFTGLLLGIVLVTALVMGGVLGIGGDTAASEQAIQADVTQYLEDNKQALLASSPLPADATSISAFSVSPVEDADLYEVTVTLEATIQNQTGLQNTSVYVTSNGRYLFFNIFDTTQPITQQTR